MVADIVGSAVVRQMQVRRTARRLLEAEVRQEPYRGTAWGRPYWEAIELYKEAWEPYYVYRVGTMTTPFINVSDGVRATYRTAAGSGVPNRLVFVFGGSAAWGHGSRDENTIPSWLARVAEEQGETLDVRNIAESVCVNSHGITLLSQTLADGERPHTVFFYSGVNEILSGRQWPQVRHPVWDGEAVPRAMADWSLERSWPLARVWDYYRNTSFLWSRLVPRAPVLAATPHLTRSELAQQLAADYGAAHDLVEQMGRAFGFRTVFAWQLTVADKPSLTAQEQHDAGWLPPTPATTPAIAGWSMDAELTELYGEVGRMVKEKGTLDVTDALLHTSGTAFIDWMHTSEAGNERVARALYEHIRTSTTE